VSAREIALVNDILHRAISKKLYRSIQDPGAHRNITGLDHLDKVIVIDQSPSTTRAPIRNL